MDADYFGRGDWVNVEEGDAVSHNFTGIVLEVRDGIVIVEDEDGECWTVNPNQLTFCSDRHMHH